MPTDTFFNLPAEKRQLIINLAIEEFADHDYKNASISRIVARADIAKGSFYQYFADKQELYLYLLQLVADEKRAFLTSTRPPDPDDGVFATLRWLFRHGLDFEFSNPRLAQIGYRAVYGDAPLPAETAAQMGSATDAFFRPLVERGMATGEIDPNLDADLVAFMFKAITTQLGDYLLKRLALPPAALLEKGLTQLDQSGYLVLTDELLDILERGVAPDGDMTQIRAATVQTEEQ